MPEIPKENRVAIRICYNGYIHNAVALNGEEADGRSSVHIFDLPKGFHEEHGIHQIDYGFRTRCLLPDSSGEHGWVSNEIVDLDAFAGASEMTD